MPRTEYDNFDEQDSEYAEPAESDQDDPDESDMDDDDGPDVVPCPYCGKSIPEDADICPHCRNFVSAGEVPRRHPWWIWVGLILCLLGVLLWVF